MASKLISSKELAGVRVVGGKSGTRRIGKVRQFVFHPSERRCIGFIVKRPDLLWMFHRKDVFVSIEGYDLIDGRVAMRPEAPTGRAACKELGIEWDSCVLWEGLPVMTEDGTTFGLVGNVIFNRLTGMVDSFETDAGATANALLGRRTIPADLVRGFSRGKGAALAQTGREGRETEEVVLGAILVDDEAKSLVVEGGVAEQAGKATAVAVDKVQATVEKAKPVVREVAEKTGKAVNKGAFATGKQIAATKGMFSGFKEEYVKARGAKPAARQGPAHDAGGQALAPDARDGSVHESPATRAAEPEPAKARQAAAKQQSDERQSAKRPAAKKPAPKKNMFAAFKEEYDKARRDD